MPQEFEFDVFVSYSRKDQAVVLDLAQRLRSEGVRVWLDLWEIQIGDSIPAKIEYGLMNSRLLLLCISAHALGADWPILEKHTARFRDHLNNERALIPLRLGDIEAPLPLASLSYLDWYKNNKDAFAQLRLVCQVSQRPDTARSIIKSTYEITSLPNPGLLYSAAVSMDNKLLLRGGEKGMLELWQIGSQKCLRRFFGHTWNIYCVALSPDDQYAFSGSADNTVRLWNLSDGACQRVLAGHTNYVRSVTFSHDGKLILSASHDKTLRLWDSANGKLLRLFVGHSSFVFSAIFTPDARFAISCSDDRTIRFWDVNSAKCLWVFNGHTDSVQSIAISADGKLVLSGSKDKTLRLWNMINGDCVHVLEGHTDQIESVALSTDGRFAASGSINNALRLWNTQSGTCLYSSPEYNPGNKIKTVAFITNEYTLFTVNANSEFGTYNFPSLSSPTATISTTLQYTNAKVLIVGDSHAGKTGLTERLACDTFTPTDSTAGAWATQWPLPAPSDAATSCQREIWLWDFGGQADQRLIHQLFMDQAALILLVFNADNEDVLPGLQEWQTALHRSLPTPPPQLLVAGRTDVGFKASRARLQAFAVEHGFGYFETSAKSAAGCAELRAAIIASIEWDKIPRRTSPLIFKQIKDVILQLRDEKQVLHTFKELHSILEKRLPPDAHFDTPILQTVISLLDGPGVIKQLDYGSYVLLQPEWINAYAQAVIRTLRADERELGALPLGAIAEGKLIFQSMAHNGRDQIDMQRLKPQAMERIVLREMEKQLEERFI
jgi:small GTP-binding protein